MQTRRRTWVAVGISLAAAACGADDGLGPGGPDAPGGAGGTKEAIAACIAGAADIAQMVRCLPGVEVQGDDVITEGIDAGYRRIAATIDQLVDHDHPGTSTHFPQRITLFYQGDVERPLFLATTGYEIGETTGALERTFGGNVLQLEHRYFGSSFPDPVDWELLDLRRSAGDSHAVTQAFKNIFRGKWVNTGVSKGGRTAVYHRRFFPEDVDATVAFVAPLLRDVDDARFPPFVASVGGDTFAVCRDKLALLQRAVLDRRDEVEALMTGSYELAWGKDVALEQAVVQIPFGFWKHTNPRSAVRGCASLPSADADAQTLYDFVDQTASLTAYQDEHFLVGNAFYHQAYHQCGTPATDRSQLADRLRHPDSFVPSYVLGPHVPVPAWDGGAAMADIDNWVKTASTRMMFVYGEFDPWTAAPFEINVSGDNRLYVASGGNHGAKLANLSDADRADALAALVRWIGASPEMSFVARPEDEAPRRERRIAD